MLQELLDLLERDPNVYRATIARMRSDNPAAFAELVEGFRAALAVACKEEDLETEKKQKAPIKPPARGYVRRHSSIAALLAVRPKKIR